MFWLGLLLVALLVASGLSHIKSAKKGEGDRIFGVLTLVLACLGLVGHSLAASGRFLVAPEIGVMMYEGSGLLRAGPYLLLIGIAFASALVPEAVRRFVDGTTRFRWHRVLVLLAAAALVSWVSCLWIHPLNPEDLIPLQIQVYDFFFPPLVLWTLACLLLPLQACCIQLPSALRPSVPVALAVLFAGWTLTPWGGEPFDDPATLAAWWWTAGVVSLAFGLSLIPKVRAALAARVKPFLEKMKPFLERIGGNGDNADDEPAAAERAAAKTDERTRRNKAAVALAILVGGLVAGYLLTSSGLLQIKLQVSVIGYLLFWLVFAELKGGAGSLTGRLGQRPPQEKDAPAAAGGAAAGGAAAGGAAAGGAAAGGAAAGEEKSLNLYERYLGKTVAALVTLVLVGTFLLVLNEIPNRQKTMVMPFRDLAGDRAKGLGEGIAEYVCYRLAHLDQGLRQMPIPLSGPAPRRSSSGFALGSGTDDATSFASTTEVVIAGVRIPFHVILSPIQSPIRHLLGTRVIRGSVHLDGESYSLIATSTRGESWRVKGRRPERPAVAGKGPLHDRIYGDLTAGRPRGGSVQVADGTGLADELAFEIYAGSASLAGPKSGMTRSWEAFQEFWDGFSKLRQLEENPGSASWEEAIGNLDEALRSDPSFALAGYHLALAWLERGRIDKAIPILRETVRRVPEFLPAYNALAYTLLRWNEDEEEAENLWKRIVLSSERQPISRALAYHGLAHLALDPDDLLAAAEGLEEPAEGENGNEDQEGGARAPRKSAANDLATNTRAFYYARKAERFYGEAGTADPRIVKRRAAAFADLGRVLERRQGRVVAVGDQVWSCRGQNLLFGLDAQVLESLRADTGVEPELLPEASDLPSAGTEKGAAWALETRRNTYVVVDSDELLAAFERYGLEELSFRSAPQPTGQGDVWRFETSEHGTYVLILEGQRLNVYGNVLRQSPYSKVARRFLRRAIVLEPHDPTVLCQLAASNYVLDRKGPMGLLKGDSKMRLALVHRYLVHYPQRDATAEVPAYFYDQANDECEVALRMSPGDKGVLRAQQMIRDERSQRSPVSVTAVAPREEPAERLEGGAPAAVTSHEAQTLEMNVEEAESIYIPSLQPGDETLDQEEFL